MSKRLHLLNAAHPTETVAYIPAFYLLCGSLPAVMLNRAQSDSLPESLPLNPSLQLAGVSSDGAETTRSMSKHSQRYTSSINILLSQLMAHNSTVSDGLSTWRLRVKYAGQKP
jgi:hypothetical protein